MGDAGQRLESILHQLTIPESISLLAGKDLWHTASISHKGLPSIRLSDGPSGVRGRRTFQASPTTCFPCPVALASTWDTELLKQVGVQMAGQAKAQGVHVMLTPTINIQRSPLGGRNFESFSEDPVLSGHLAAGLVRGLQSEGIAATVKHFICNDQETNRTKVDVIVEQRPLREIYLKPFQIVVRNAKPWAIMASYNRVNGLHVSESPDLLQGILRSDWGWDGAIISDWYATYSTTEAIKAGLDLEMPGPTEWRGKLIKRAINAGKLDANAIRDRVKNIINLVERTSISGVPEDAQEYENNTPEVRAVNRKAASDSVVLLKNASRLLPIQKPGRVAVIGPNANEDLYCGGGSSTVFPYYYVSAFQGIKQALGDKFPSSEVIFSQGCYKHALLPLLETETPGGQKGLKLDFYDRDFTIDAEAKKVAETDSRTWRLVFFDSLPKEALPLTYGRCAATFRAPGDGPYQLGVCTTGRAKLYVDGVLLADNWTKQERSEHFFGYGTTEVRGTLTLVAGKQYDVLVEYTNISSFPERSPADLGGGILRLGICPVVDTETLLKNAVEAACSADTVICCIGTDQEHESEGWDRKDMKLPGGQDQLVEAVLKANPRTVIVNFSGSPVEMPWVDQASTVVQGWFMGSELGNAVADVLFGNVSPSGKLPVSFPKRLEQNPSYGNFPDEDMQVRYAEGIMVGYRHYQSRCIPTLFPFGHGLSYTTFAYGELTPDGRTDLHPDKNIVLSLTVSNSGDRASHETVQLYISALASSVFRPSLELQGFQKIHDLQPGEGRKVQFTIDKYSLSYYNEARQKWTTEAGEYRVSVGTSVEDLRSFTLIKVPTTFEWTGL